MVYVSLLLCGRVSCDRSEYGVPYCCHQKPSSRPTEMCWEVVDISLPREVLEMVFTHVPIFHLLTVDACVCRYWNKVILNPAFIPWRKFYHRLKLLPWSVTSSILLFPTGERDKLTANDIISAICQRHGLTSLRYCITSVIRLDSPSRGSRRWSRQHCEGPPRRWSRRQR
ncbi:uncharacterized protein [Procambarus clarkii]|uniref:uncharacterized protein n=1 Tax=Procambarus clarkii TaxID=6728 RepID=UPI0037420673